MSDSQQSAPAAAQASSAPESELLLGIPQKEAEKQPEKTEEVDYSSRFAALSRREKQLIDKERRIKEMESKYKDNDSNYKSWEEKKANFKKNPDSIFEEVGMTFDEMVNFKLGIAAEEKVPGPDDMYKKLKLELEQDFDSKAKAKEELEQKTKKEAREQQNAQTIENFKTEIVETVKRQADKYELINYQGNYDLVYDVVQQYFNETEEVLSLEQAADHVEAYLESLVEGATKLKKFQSRFAPKSETQQPIEGAFKTNPGQEQTPKTLSNALTSQNSSYNGESVSVEESKRRAAALLRWNK